MTLRISVDQQLLRETTRRFLETSCPVTTVRQLGETAAGFERDWWRRGAALGWTSMLVDEALGGGSVSELGLHDLALVAEEMGRAVSPGPFLPTNVVASALSSEKIDESHHGLVGALVSGDAVATWCVEEPHRGWDGVPFAVEARPTADGVVLNGLKSPVEAAAESDVLLVTTRWGDGVAQVLVPAAAPGLTITPQRSVDLVRRFASVRFDDVRLPASSIVGDPARSPQAVERQLCVALALQLAETVGAADRVFDFTCEWAFDRYSFGRPLASYQALKHKFADMKLWLEGSRAVTAAAVEAVATGAPDATEVVSAAKSYVGDVAPEIIQGCVQMHGGIGVTWDHDIHLYLRRVTVNSALYGTPRDHRLRLATMAGLTGRDK